MAVTREIVLHIAKLSRLALDEEEVVRYQHDLNQILGYVAKLDELDTSEVEPTTHAVPTAMRLREDRAESRLTIDRVLMNAPAQEDGMFQVPKVVEG